MEQSSFILSVLNDDNIIYIARFSPQFSKAKNKTTKALVNAL